MTISLKAVRSLGVSEVNLQGNPIVYAGSTNTYAITDYNSFSSWSVSSNVGTATISSAIITLVVANPIGASQINLTVTKDGKQSVFVIAAGVAIVNKPSITSPSAGQTNVALNPLITGTAYSTTPTGQGTHQSSQWQVATTPDFLNLFLDTGTDTANLTQITVNGLAINTVYYARVKYTSSTIGTSAWSDAITFTTTNEYVVTPTVSVTGAPSDVGETPTLSTSAFSVSGGTDTHYATDWQIVKVSDSSIVWQSNGNTTNKTSIVVPAGILQVSTQYKARARHIGSTVGESAWGELAFTTKSQFFVFGPSSAGLPYGGGYYAGANIVVSGKTYALIVAPAAQGGQTSSLQWKTGATATSGATSINDGFANTNAMIAAGASAHPAAQFCDNLTINGYTDWYLPSKDELEICYRYLKPSTNGNDTTSGANSSSSPTGSAYTSGTPSQSIATIFKSGNSEAFSTTGYYWASTEASGAPGSADIQGFLLGTQGSNPKTNSYSARAVRRVAI